MRVALAFVFFWGALGVAWSGDVFAESAPAAPPSGAVTAPSAAPPSPTSTLSAGGLAPPPAIEPTPTTAPGVPTPASTEAELARADAEDSGRGLQFVWLNAEVGVTHVMFGGHHFDPGYGKRDETGVVAGAGAGVRLVFVTLGARFRYAVMPDYTLWTLGLEGGIHAPLGNFEPYGTLDLGYASLGSFAGANVVSAIQGLDARLALGADYFFTPIFSLGLNASGDFLLLHRSPMPCPELGGPTRDDCHLATGTAGALSATAVAGLHF